MIYTDDRAPLRTARPQHRAAPLRHRHAANPARSVADLLSAFELRRLVAAMID